MHFWKGEEEDFCAKSDGVDGKGKKVFFALSQSGVKFFFFLFFRRENLANFSKEQQEKGRKGELVSHSSRKRKRREESEIVQKKTIFFSLPFFKGKAKLLNPAAHFLSKSVF